MPKIVSDSEVAAPLSSLVNPGRFVEALVRPLTADLFPVFAERYLDNTYRISGVPRAKYAKPPNSTSRITSMILPRSSMARRSPAFSPLPCRSIFRSAQERRIIGSSPAPAPARRPR